VTVDATGQRPCGSLELYRWKDGRTVTYRGRVRAHGERHRIDFGTNHAGWSTERAERELEVICGQIERGTWVPPESVPATVRADQSETVHVTLSRWWERRCDELAQTTRADYEWRLAHLLRHLASAATSDLDARAVDELRIKLRRAGLSPRSTWLVGWPGG
jgi:hypothetical protein